MNVGYLKQMEEKKHKVKEDAKIYLSSPPEH